MHSWRCRASGTHLRKGPNSAQAEVCHGKSLPIVPIGMCSHGRPLHASATRDARKLVVDGREWFWTNLTTTAGEHAAYLVSKMAWCGSFKRIQVQLCKALSCIRMGSTHVRRLPSTSPWQMKRSARASNSGTDRAPAPPPVVGMHRSRQAMDPHNWSRRKPMVSLSLRKTRRVGSNSSSRYEPFERGAIWLSINTRIVSSSLTPRLTTNR